MGGRNASEYASFAPDPENRMEVLVNVLELGLHNRKQLLQEGLVEAAFEMGSRGMLYYSDMVCAAMHFKIRMNFYPMPAYRYLFRMKQNSNEFNSLFGMREEIRQAPLIFSMIPGTPPRHFLRPVMVK